MGRPARGAILFFRVHLVQGIHLIRRIRGSWSRRARLRRVLSEPLRPKVMDGSGPGAVGSPGGSGGDGSPNSSRALMKQPQHPGRTPGSCRWWRSDQTATTAAAACGARAGCRPAPVAAAAAGSGVLDGPWRLQVGPPGVDRGIDPGKSSMEPAVSGPDARGIGERARASDGLGVNKQLEELSLDRQAQRAGGPRSAGHAGLGRVSEPAAWSADTGRPGPGWPQRRRARPVRPRRPPPRQAGGCRPASRRRPAAPSRRSRW
jgi:hypothetical protein